MALVLTEVDDPSTGLKKDVYVANPAYTLTTSDGSKTITTKVEATPDGNFQVYETNRSFNTIVGIPVSLPDKLVYSYDASNNTYTFNSNDGYKLSDYAGASLDTVNKSIKTDLYTTVPPNAANKLSDLTGYKSIANSNQPRSPIVDPNAVQALQQATGVQQNLSVVNIGTATTLTNEQLGISQSKFLSNFGQVRYPTDIGNNGQDYIKFDLIEYGTKEFGVGAGALDQPLGTRKRETLGATVILPIQPSINDQNAVNWGEENATAVQLMTAALSRNSGSIPDFLQSGVDQITGNTAYQDLILKQLAGMGAGINPLARTDGLIINPNLELLFNGPTLRPFTFVFRLSPRNKPESNDVKKIIRFFKEGSAVKTTNTGLFLKAPNVFNISYNGIGANGLNKIKTCALRNVNVNYTPDGSYMTFRDGTMTSYEINLQFSELEPIYDKDYNTVKDNEIGY
jgi:hypothetical protein